MRCKIINAPHWGAPFDTVQFRGARLPIEHRVDVRSGAPFHFGGHVRRLHQSESLMPVRAAEDAGIQHPTHYIESIATPRPRASGRSRRMTEREGFSRLEWGVVSIRSPTPSSPRTQEFRLVQIIPGKTRAHAVRAMAEMTGCRFASQVGICAEQLDEAMVLEHVNCLQRPVVSREVEVAIHIATVLPIGREPSYSLVDGAFLDPKARVRPQLQVERIFGTGDFVRPISEGNFDDMQHNVRTRLHVEPKIMESFSSALPAVRV